MATCTAPDWCDRCQGHGVVSVPNPDGSDNAVIRRCPGVEEQPARTISIPAEWYLGAHGDPVARFDYLHLRLHPDGSVTWFSDAPDSGSERAGS